MKNIHIPEPCHENWADFTPTEKGGFCQSCSIDVIDFSNKTPDEVKQILKANAGKHMCGRFKKSQLEELNDSFYAWENQSAKSFQSKFLYACLIAFGMTLFTSCNLNEQHVLGEIAVEWNDESAQSQLNPLTPANMNESEKDSTKKPNRHVKGKIKYVADEEDLPLNCTEPDSNDLEELHLLGEVAYTPDEDTLFDDIMVDGEIRWTPEFEEFVEDTVVESTEIPDPQIVPEVENILVITNPIIFDSHLYPNPTNDISRVVLDVKTEEIFNILLYAIDGKKVKTIHDGILSTGRQEFIIDLTSYEAGTYLIMINSHQQKASLKVEKL
jgi:hypothetical protein